MEYLQSETDRYGILKVLGRGTFGEVMKSWKRGSAELVAIKMLKNDMFRSHIIKNELKLLAALREVDSEEHHIIRFHEYFHQGGNFYLVFELLHQNLFEFQKANNFRPLPVRHIRTITSQVLKALSKLKDLSIIHADLKPENIMLVDQPKYPFRVKVIDFGSASIFNEVRFIKEPYIQSRFYRSPEVLLGLPFCEKVDMWSLGCIMAELALGWPLYPGDNEYDQIRYICETQGLPRNRLLATASRTHRFFKKSKEQTGGRWRLKTIEEYQLETNVHPLECRKYRLGSLDHIKLVTSPALSCYPDNEILAEYYDRKSMVELIKQMLTWDSHQRINPSAALSHPFICLLYLRVGYNHTRYYQMSVRCLQDSIKEDHAGDYLSQHGYQQGVVERCYGEDVAGMERTIKQMDELSIKEPRNGSDSWLEGKADGNYRPGCSAACQHHPNYKNSRPHHEPMTAYYGSHRTTRNSEWPGQSKPGVTVTSLIFLGEQSPGEVTKWVDEESSSLSSTSSSMQDPGAREDQSWYKKSHLSPSVEAKACGVEWKVDSLTCHNPQLMSRY